MFDYRTKQSNHLHYNAVLVLGFFVMSTLGFLVVGVQWCGYRIIEHCREV